MESTSSRTTKSSKVAPSFKHRFRWQGRLYTLRKRVQSQLAPWYLVSEINKHRFNHSLDSNIAAVAQRTAVNQYIRPAREGRWEVVEAAGLKGNPMTVGELLAIWDRLPAERGAGYVVRVANAFRNVLRRAGYEQPDRQRLEAVLTKETVERWRASVLGECGGLEQEAQARVKRSQNSIFLAAKCLFSTGALGDYEAAKVRLPDPGAFLTAYRQRKFRKVEKEEAPLDRAGMRARIGVVWREGDENMRRALCLMLGFGLRKGEVGQVTWAGLRVIEGSWWLDQAADVKRGSGRLVVHGLDPWVRLLRAGRSGEGLVVEGNETERGEEVFRRIGSALRDEGWSGQKTNHALRAFAGGEVALKYGVYQAQGWLRHKSITTTEKHYTRAWLETAARAPRIRWATALRQ